MFGTVRAYKPEMKFKDYETYKAIYCSICKTVGKEYGRLMRLTLSYDLVFMAALGMSVQEENVCYETKKCRVNPLKKCSFCKGKQEIIKYTSAVLVLLSEAKLRDEISDSGFINRILCRILKLFFIKPVKKATSDYPEAADVVNTYISDQNHVEKDYKGSLDEIAEPTAKSLSKLFSLMSNDTSNKRIFEQIGYMLGKWIYILDAVLDYDTDVKKRRFNPFAKLSYCEAVKRAEPILNTCNCLIADDYALLSVKRYKAILENIIYFGLIEVKKKSLSEEQK